MNRRDFLKGLTAAGASLTLPVCFSVAADASVYSGKRRTNIIFIMTDDMASWAYGAAPNGDAYTPNIDKLCSEAVSLENCFVTTPVCSPSRASLLTSRYSTEVGITDFIGSPKTGLDASFPAWPRFLAQAGYATALIGKWHLGEKDKFHPTQFGYDEFTGFRWGARTSKDPMIEVKGEVQQAKGYTPDILTNHAIDFIRRRKDMAFMLSLHYWAPHCSTLGRTPDQRHTWLPLSDIDFSRYKEKALPLPDPDYPNLDKPAAERMMAEYLGAVASLDRNVGRLMNELDNLKLTDNTVVIFTSDNGYNIGHNGVEGKGNSEWVLKGNRSDRPNLYDNSLRVPAFIRWPVKIKPGISLDHTITFLDWFPTLLAIAGLDTPKDKGIHGRNFLPLLMGKSIQWDNDLFAQYTMRGAGAMRMYKKGRWKLVRDFMHIIKDELYDLKTDPHEHINIIDTPEAEIQKQRRLLNEKLLEKMLQINDPALALIQSDNEQEIKGEKI
jgi:choline-sulfatase